MEDARNTLRDWLQNLNFERDIEQVFTDVLHELSWFQKKRVTFSFKKGNTVQADIDNNNITVYHPNIIPKSPPAPPYEPPYKPADWSSGYIIEAGLGGKTGVIIKVLGVFQQDVEGILRAAMTAWQQLPDAALAVPVTLTYKADNKEIVMTGEGRDIHIRTDDHQAN